jgi:hypothetical protein
MENAGCFCHEWDESHPAEGTGAVQVYGETVDGRGIKPK